MFTGGWRGFQDFTVGPKVTEQPFWETSPQQSHSQDTQERDMANTVPGLCMEVTQIISTNILEADRSPSLWEGPRIGVDSHPTHMEPFFLSLILKKPFFTEPTPASF